MNDTLNKQVLFQDLGLMDYKACWDYQEELMADTLALKMRNRKEGLSEPTPNHLLFVEHPHVYTLGKSGDPKNLLLDEQGLAEHQATYYPINRGGDITYHGPGQLVGYPVIDLENFFTDIHKYLRLLEEAVMLTVADFGIASGRIEGLTGVWVDHEEQKDPRKICAMGVKASRWVTLHGLALNVNSDLSYFGHIIPCGIDDKAVTSIEKELGHTVDMEAVKAKLKAHLGALFGFDYATA